MLDAVKFGETPVANIDDGAVASNSCRSARHDAANASTTTKGKTSMTKK